MRRPAKLAGPRIEIEDEIDRIVARNHRPTPRPTTMFRVFALVMSELTAGRPFPRQVDIARRLERHVVVVQVNMRRLSEIGYIVPQGRRWRVNEMYAAWVPCDETYEAMMSLYFSLRRRWQSFR